VTLILIVANCRHPTTITGDVLRIVSTTSFGMCAGYCKTTLEITEGAAVLTRETWSRGPGGDLPVQRFPVSLTAAEWQDIVDAAVAATIEALPDTIGCPDCADGGAESLTIVGTHRNKTINFDHGADVREAARLLARVRGLRARLLPKT
jgi:hypothetical protein